MKTPQFVQEEYISEGVLNQAASDTLSSIKDIGANLHTAGLINPSSLGFSFNNTLVVGVTTPSTFSVLFGDGTVAYGFGNTDGTTSSSYSVDFSSVVPSSGSVTAYLIASLSTINQNSYINTGPPVGHPDYSATFIPTTEWETSQYTLTLAASTTPPDNITTFSLGQLTLLAAQTAITSLTYTWEYASAVLKPNGVVAGLYNYASVTVDDTGRITNISAGTADFASINGNSANTFAVANATASTDAINLGQGNSLYAPVTIQQANIAAGAVHQSQLNTSTGTYTSPIASAAGSSLNASFALPGGSFGFMSTHDFSNLGSTRSFVSRFGSEAISYTNTYDGTTAFVLPQTDPKDTATYFSFYAYYGAGGSGDYWSASQTYINASAPYSLGYGEIPLFMFTLVNKNTGEFYGMWLADCPPWAYNGPTSIKPDFIDHKTGKKYKKERLLPNLSVAKSSAEITAAISNIKNKEFKLIEITPEYKNTDMHIIPHPFHESMVTDDFVVVMLDPLSKFVSDVYDLYNHGETLSPIFDNKFLKINNKKLNVNSPNGVLTCTPNWK